MDVQEKADVERHVERKKLEVLEEPYSAALTLPTSGRSFRFSGCAANIVDDKYEYSIENKDNGVHGWICFDPPVGFWQICPSNEFRTGSPTKQDLTSHVNPTTLAMFVSAHYGGEELSLQIGSGEPWKKVFGPVFIYLNSVSDRNNAFSLWDNAKEQMKVEVQSWPYSFPNSEDFPKSDQRGTVIGKFLVHDRCVLLCLFQFHLVQLNSKVCIVIVVISRAIQPK
ncbi:uncharacterized protein LOC114303978 [Camellia sinensis]|uniref:uncharacterized protein LOC114303978 n=1 Tax=Camellia sinensis TaxID=4442 RepID=UPI001035BE72|nr:uncharacterized protein LOC114303978 [Camellia sinensis]